MRNKDLQEDGHSDWDSDDQIPSYIKIFVWSYPLWLVITGCEHIVVSKEEHKGIVDVLEDKDSHSSVSVTSL